VTQIIYRLFRKDLTSAWSEATVLEFVTEWQLNNYFCGNSRSNELLGSSI